MNVATIASWAEKNLSNAGALKSFRQENILKFKELGFLADPEAYKYTNVTSFLENLQDLEAESTPSAADDRFYNLVFVKGELTSRPAVKGLNVRLSEDASVFQEFATMNPFTHLHHGLSRIIQIELDKNTKLDRPLKLTFMDSELDAPTVYFKIQPHAEIAIFEDHTFSQNTHVLASEVYFSVAAGARVEHVQLDHSGAQGLNHHVTFTKVAKDATYRNVAFHTGGKLVRRNFVAELNESGARAEAFALYLTNGEEHSDLNTVIHHKAADTTSQQIAKGILDGTSRGIFTGKIHIHPNAQRVASGQLNKNLLLSKKAQAHSQPQLEIFADDVKCSHGSTTGQLSDDELFYFKARGIPEDRARTLLAHAFGMEIVLKIEHPVLKKILEEKIMKTMKEKFQLGSQL